MSLPTVSPLTSIGNKIQYLIAKNISDPDANAYAQQQARQQVQDLAVKKQQAKLDIAAAKEAADTKIKEEEVASLAARSKFDTKQLISDAAIGTLKAVGILIIVCLALYGGHIVANQSIGYSVPFRILSFVYGSLLSFWILPKSLYDIYWLNKTLPYYSFLPLSTYIPSGDLEKIFLGPFCYTETGESRAARAAMEALYSNAFAKSVSAATAAATVAAAAVGLTEKNTPKNINSQKKNVTNSPVNNTPVTNVPVNNNSNPTEIKANANENTSDPVVNPSRPVESLVEPTVEEPKVEEPKLEEPKVEEAKVDESKVEEAKVEQPKVEQPKVLSE